MVCEKCGEQEATVVFTQIVSHSDEGFRKTVFHLCKACAHLKEADGLTIEIGISAVSCPAPPEECPDGPTGPTCPGCGMSYQTFHQGGRLGCHNCYTAFASDLLPILKRSHGDTAHHGKVPAGLRPRAELSDRLSSLKDALKDAVSLERFEEAAVLRDEISAIKQLVDEE